MLRVAKRENVAVFLDWVLQLKPLMVVTEEAIPGPDPEKDEPAETSDQTISCVVSSGAKASSLFSIPNYSPKMLLTLLDKLRFLLTFYNGRCMKKSKLS